MFILPLHKPLDRATFPWMTMLLVLANVAVFFGWQSGDPPLLGQARAYYATSGLGALELPAYGRYLRQRGQSAALAELDDVPGEARQAWVQARTLDDPAFRRALAGGALFDDAQQSQAWSRLRPRYDALLERVFTLRHTLRSSEIAPGRMLASAFLHGGLGHLVGNMLFLIAIGLLLEGAIGPWRLLAVYLLGAFASSAVALWWRWGQVGGGLGASGAIAALMGAFCVVWGRRPVRFFYWFGVMFDYVRAPALVLLPAWLGWELYNLLFSDERGIGFDAHAGGLAAGAVMGAALVAARQTRPAFMEEDRAGAADDRWERAQAYLGRMHNLEAERVLAELESECPGRFEVVQARWQVAGNAGHRLARRERALQLLALPATDAAQVQVQREVLDELARNGQPPSPGTCLALARCWAGLGCLADAEAVLQAIPDEAADRAGLAQAWFGLALRQDEAMAGAARRRLLGRVVQCFPEQPQAAKARFLLDNG